MSCSMHVCIFNIQDMNSRSESDLEEEPKETISKPTDLENLPDTPIGANT